MALNPESDIASQTSMREEDLLNLQEAVEFFLACASSHEIAGRLSGDTWITQFEAEYARA